MAEDWSVDVRKYAPNASDSVIQGIVRHCGISLNKRDSSLVAFSDPDELRVVRESFLRKKLGLTNPDSELDAAIAEVGDRMRADRTKNRVTVYYLLAEHFRKLGDFGEVAVEKASRVMEGIGAGAAATAATAASATMAGVAQHASTVERAVERPATPTFAARPVATPPAKGGSMRWLLWLLLAAVVLGLLWWLFSQRRPTVPATIAPAAVTAPAVPAVPTAPAIAVAGLPANVFFETDLSAINGQGGDTIRAAAEAIKASNAKIALTGYTDRTGDLAHNQELAKNRAVAVRDALMAAGVPEANIEMRPPVMVEIGASGPDADARRVQITPQ